MHNASAVMRSCEVFGIQELNVIEQLHVIHVKVQRRTASVGRIVDDLKICRGHRPVFEPLNLDSDRFQKRHEVLP